jgi:nitrogen fixation-related uncharacterized protein
MSGEAIFMMVTIQVLVTFIAGRFFWMVLNSQAKPEPDSYSDNDPE